MCQLQTPRRWPGILGDHTLCIALAGYDPTQQTDIMSQTLLVINDIAIVYTLSHLLKLQNLEIFRGKHLHKHQQFVAM